MPSPGPTTLPERQRASDRSAAANAPSRSTRTKALTSSLPASIAANAARAASTGDTLPPRYAAISWVAVRRAKSVIVYLTRAGDTNPNRSSEANPQRAPRPITPLSHASITSKHARRRPSWGREECQHPATAPDSRQIRTFTSRRGTTCLVAAGHRLVGLLAMAQGYGFNLAGRPGNGRCRPPGVIDYGSTIVNCDAGGLHPRQDDPLVPVEPS